MVEQKLLEALKQCEVDEIDRLRELLIESGSDIDKLTSDIQEEFYQRFLKRPPQRLDRSNPLYKQEIQAANTALEKGDQQEFIQHILLPMEVRQCKREHPLYHGILWDPVRDSATGYVDKLESILNNGLFSSKNYDVPHAFFRAGMGEDLYGPLGVVTHSPLLKQPMFIDNDRKSDRQPDRARIHYVFSVEPITPKEPFKIWLKQFPDGAGILDYMNRLGYESVISELERRRIPYNMFLNEEGKVIPYQSFKPK